MLDEIEDESLLNLVFEGIAFYTSEKDIIDELEPSLCEFICPPD